MNGLGAKQLRTQMVTMLNGSQREVTEITYGEWKQTRNSSDDFDNDVALVIACTGMKAEEMETLDTPDFNELKRAAIRLNNPTIAPLAGQTEIPLSVPVTNTMGETRNTATITIPSLAISRELSKLQEHQSRLEYMVRSTTGIISLHDLPMSDYSLLVVSVQDFFEEGAAYFLRNK